MTLDALPLSVLAPRKAAEQMWDVIIVGGGMGGASCAHALTARGIRVLVIEKGDANPLSDAGAEVPSGSDPARYGRWSQSFDLLLDGQRSRLNAALGMGIGGSTLLYAASLARFEENDFAAPGQWPIDYQTLEPYYLEAERLFEVNGTQDPLNTQARYELADPPPMGDRDRHLFSEMQAAGLHPYRIHNAIRYVAGCTECGGTVCPRACKGDARNRLMSPAMQTGQLSVVEHADVLRFELEGDRVTGVVIDSDQTYTLRAKTFVAAAGALSTPTLLLRSTSKEFVRGIGNDADQVGRNLMLHASDFVAVWPKKKAPINGPTRTIATREFYTVEGEKLGEFQSMGLKAGYGEILTYLYQRFDRSMLRRLKIAKPFLRIPAYVGAKLFREASVFATIVEDSPMPNNRVALAEGGRIVIEYTIPRELTLRVKKLRQLLKQHLPTLRILVVNDDISLNFGHACGTCRMGSDSRHSVVDEKCQVHGMRNLFIADASVFPSSGGTNPSLTVAANALRVSRHIAENLQ